MRIFSYHFISTLTYSLSYLYFDKFTIRSVGWCDGASKVHPLSSVWGSEVQTPGGWLASNARVSPATRVSNNSRRIWLLAWWCCLHRAVRQLAVYVLSYLYQLRWGQKSTQLIAGFRPCCLMLSACVLLNINTFELFLGFAKPLQMSVGHWKWYIRGYIAQTNFDSRVLLQCAKVGNYFKFIPQCCWID